MLRKPSVHIIPQDLIEFNTDYKKLEQNVNENLIHNFEKQLQQMPKTIHTQVKIQEMIQKKNKD